MSLPTVPQPFDLQHNVSPDRKRAQPDLVQLAALYLAAQVRGQADATERAKRSDLERFLRFYFELYGHYRPEQWYVLSG